MLQEKRSETDSSKVVWYKKNRTQNQTIQSLQIAKNPLQLLHLLTRLRSGLPLEILFKQQCRQDANSQIAAQRNHATKC